MKPRPVSRPPSAVAAAATKATALFKQGFALHQQGQIPQAQALYAQVLKQWPRHALALHLLGVIALDGDQPAVALELISASLAIAPQDAAAWNSKAVALHRLERYPESLVACDEAVALKPDLPESQFNRGNAQLALKQLADAIASFDRAIALRPDYGKAHASRGLALVETLDYASALPSFDKAIALRAELDQVWPQRLLARLNLCDWAGIEAQIAEFLQRVLEGKTSAGPLTVLSVTDSPGLQRMAAANHVKGRQLPTREAATVNAPEAGRRLRIAYFSMDFRAHAVSYLTAQLYELHDRTRFEVFAFSYGPDSQDETRQRLERAFDHFIDVRDKTDLEVADLARSQQIDIAVDLAGLTGEARTGIFALRAAPVQVNYIGFPGTMAAPYIDYIIGDDTLIPARLADAYTEKIAWLPSFQANDRRRPAAHRVVARGELGLPDEGFVYCCFHRSNKLLPQMWDSWCRILARVPESTLLLHAIHPRTQANLRHEAQARGIAATRLVFAGAAPQAEYLARLRTADLLLDTFPFNGGTTVSDALWVGLPVLTRAGEAYASRMGASLLQAARLPELVTTSQQAYEDLAVQLALQPARLRALRERLQRDQLTVPLFDSAAFTRNLEAAFERMHEQGAAGRPPQHIRIG